MRVQLVGSAHGEVDHQRGKNNQDHAAAPNHLTGKNHCLANLTSKVLGGSPKSLLLLQMAATKQAFPSLGDGVK